MGGVPLKNGFPREESPVDSMILLAREDAVDGWLISTSTTIVSKMNLSTRLPRLLSSHSNDSLRPMRPTAQAQCSLLFSQPQCTLSISSETSDPGAGEEPSCWSGSDTTVEDQYSENELWDSYFWPQDKKDFQSSFHTVDETSVSSCQNQDFELSAYNRNCASSNLLEPNVDESPVVVHRADAAHTPRRNLKSLPNNTYSPFPTISPPPESAHKSWPLQRDSQTQYRRPPRSSALTIPTNYHHLHPSHLSICSTLDDRSSPSHGSSSSASGLCMRSAPISPDFPAPLMELMEKSYFDDDDSDDDFDEEEHKFAVFPWLHIRNASSNNSGPYATKEKQPRSQKSRMNLKSAGDAFKGIFGKKKASAFSA